MQTGLIHLHNLLRWVIIILLLLSIVKSFSGWQSKKAFTPGDKKLWLFTMMAAHITLLIGLYQWLLGRYGIISPGFPEWGKISAPDKKFYLFFQIEHPIGMILAIVLITLGRGMAKKSVNDEIKFKKAFWFFLLALIVILATVPWPFREIVGRPWFPGA
jgi:hypothetical protein